MFDSIGAPQLFLILLLAAIFVIYYKVVIPKLQDVIKVLTVIVGTVIGLAAVFVVIYFGLKSSRGESISGSMMLMSIIAGLVLATPAYLTARLIGRIQALEKEMREHKHTVERNSDLR